MFTKSEKYADEIVPYVDFDIKTSSLARQRIIMLDIIANNKWERPVYFTSGSLSDEDFLWMKDYLQLSGIAYQLVPIKTDNSKRNHPLYLGNIDTDKLYNTIMEKTYENGKRQGWTWGNNGSSKIYHDPETRRNAFLFRINLTRLAEKLIEEGKNQKAKKVVETAMTNFPIDYFGNYMTVEPFAELYYRLGEKQKAREIIDALAKKYEEDLIFYKSMKPQDQQDYLYEVIEAYQSYERLIGYAAQSDPQTANKLKEKLKPYREYFKRFLQAANLYDPAPKTNQGKSDTLSMDPIDHL